MSEDPLLRLVGHIYEGAVDATAWPAIVEHLSRFFGAAKARMFTAFVGPDKSGLSVSFGVPEAALQVWGARYIPHDVWAQIATAKGLLREGNAVLDSDLLPEREFLQTVIYREHLRHLDVTKLCSGIVFGAESADMLPTLVCVYRGSADPAFDEQNRSQMALLVPHFSRALGVMYRLRGAEIKVAAGLAALDRLDCGVVLLDAQGSVVHANREANRILEERDGLALAPAAGQARMYSLAAEDPAAQAVLSRAVASAAAIQVDVPHFSNTVSVPHRSGRRPWVLQFAPLPGANNFASEVGAVSAIAFLIDQDRASNPDAELLRRIFGATRAEAKLAALLCMGETLHTAARRLGISEETVKTQLNSLFQKTGTHRQADLMRTMMSVRSSRP